MFGHVKGEWPAPGEDHRPGDLAAELDRVRAEYNTVRLHAGIGYVTPDDEHEGRGDSDQEGPTTTGSTRPAKNASTTTDGVEDNEEHNHAHDALADGY